jgi:tRNA-modifying protein YgfZ
MDYGEILYADRSERGKLRFTGPQRAWFLHQITTNTFDPIEVGEARPAALLTAHGRMVGYFETVATDDAILMHFEPELVGTLGEQIGRYVFATAVEIDDVTESMGLVLVAGERWRDAGAAVAPGAPLHETPSMGERAGYIWAERALVSDVVLKLKEAGGREIAVAEEEAIRIAHGVPRWGRDMNSKTLPQEARLETFAINLNKGCYVGQEAVAKIHFRGKVNRVLRRLRAEAPVPSGTEIMRGDEKVGIVTSSAGSDALAMLRYTVEPGVFVEAGGVRCKVIA